MRPVFFVLFTLFFHTSFSQITINMERQGGVSVVPCKVNGLKLKFIFDTGASDVSISLTEATFMMKNGYLGRNDILGKANYTDATGSISEGFIINLREIEIAGLKLYNVRASVVTSLNAPLLLGQSAINRLGKIQLDLSANTLTIYQHPNGQGGSTYINSSAQAGGSSVTAESTVINYGKMKWGCPRSENYTFTNYTSNPIYIEGITTSCACIMAYAEQGPIDANGSKIIRIMYNAARQGQFKHKVFV
ncbi:MAG: DUF1573 domain-containing protein, partial [Chitinophagaceae bacterium]